MPNAALCIVMKKRGAFWVSVRGFTQDDALLFAEWIRLKRSLRGLLILSFYVSIFWF